MGNSNSAPEDSGFPGSAVLEKLNPCGNLSDTLPSPTENNENGISKFLTTAEGVCAMTPTHSEYVDIREEYGDNEYEEFGRRVDEDDAREQSEKGNAVPSPGPVDPASALFAKAMVNEVTNNPETMLPTAMAERERKLMKAQDRARDANKNGESAKAIGVPGGVGQASVIGSIAHALTGTTDPLPSLQKTKARVFPPNIMSENRAQVDANNTEVAYGKHTITIGLCLSQRSEVGHSSTITRQTAYDFNELQDREYNFVSSTDSRGWRAGGGEPTGSNKVAAADKVHIPIINIDAGSPQVIDAIIEALARGELFIPHMSVIPEALSVDGVSPPDLVVRFGTERNEDMPPDQWPNWCLEFMHNQLYEYFEGMGALWSKRPFSITLAKQVRWKTVKHMNQYFSHSEKVIDSWRERGPQYLDPQLAYLEGTSAPEEVAKPHGIYLFRDGVPTNYFAPNFDPPYTTNMTRNLLLNVLNKSWDKQHREWTSQPVPRLVTPGMLVSAMCGCDDNTTNGFMANEVTLGNRNGMSTIPTEASIRSERAVPRENKEVFGPEAPSKEPEVAASITPVIEESEKSINEENAEPATQDVSGSPKSTDTPSYKNLSSDLERFITSHNNKSSQSPRSQEKQVSPASRASYAASGIGASRSLDEEETAPTHVRQSSEHPSHTGTDSTVRHRNMAAEDLVKKTLESADISQTKNEIKVNAETDEPDLVSDEDWFDDFGQPIGVDTPTSVDNDEPNTTEKSNHPEQPNGNDEVEEENSEADMVENSPKNNFVEESPEADMVEESCENNKAEENSKADFVEESPENEMVEESSEAEMEEPIVTLRMASDEDLLKPKNVLNERNIPQDAPESENISKDLQNVRYQDPPESREEEPDYNQENESSLSNAREYHENVMTNNLKNTPTNSVTQIDSAFSLEYSIDSANFGDMKSTNTNQSSLMGQKYTAATSKTAVSQDFKVYEDDLPQTDSEDSEIVPSDEELFNVGWAKALDPNSGSYYYFTLDRSQIVWDNPLGSIHTRPSEESMERHLLEI